MVPELTLSPNNKQKLIKIIKYDISKHGIGQGIVQRAADQALHIGDLVWSPIPQGSPSKHWLPQDMAQILK